MVGFNTLEKLYVFMKKYRNECKKNSGKNLPYTHSMVYEPYGTYNIPEKKYMEFKKLYEDAIVDGFKPHIAEKHKEYGPIVIDLDFLQSEKHNRRYYTNNTITNIVKLYNRIIKKYLNTYSNNMTAYVSEKKEPTLKNKNYHDGLQIVYPYICTKPSLQMVMRNEFMKLVEQYDIFKSIPFVNDLESVFNKDVIYNAGWMMYGSKKNTLSHVFYVTHIYETANSKIFDTLIPGDNIHSRSYIKHFINVLSCRKFVNENDITALADDINPIDIDSQITKLNNKVDSHTISVGAGTVLDLENKNGIEIPIISNNIYQNFILSGKTDDRAIGDFFYTVYKNDYIYDSENCVWYTSNKYGIYSSEGAELLSARTKMRDELYVKVVEEYEKIIKKYRNEGTTVQIEILLTFYKNFSKKMTSVNQRKIIVEDLKEKFKVTRFREMSNNNKYIFAFDNGVYDMKTFEFRNALPEELVIETCKYNYKPSNEKMRSKVMEMIKNIFVDDDLLCYVMQVISLRLVKVNMLEEFYFFIGPGGNGKGLLTNLIEITFGNFSQALPPETFMKNKHGVSAEAANPAIASTYNSSIVFVCEPSNAMKITSDLLKRLSGNDKIKARFLRENFFEFIACYALFFVSNFEPIIDGADEGIKRRCRYIPFLVKMVANPDPNNKYERKKDMRLKQIMVEDGFKCAFFDILVSYYKDFKNSGARELIPPECVLKKTNDYLNENDAMKQFVDQAIDITNNDTDHISSTQLYTSFLNFNGGISRGYDRARFKKALNTLGVKDKHTKNGTVFCGIISKFDENDNEI